MADVRLIDANALPNFKCKVAATIGDQKGPAEMRFVFWQDIEKSPTIEAAPVVHGRWLDCENYNDIRQCSECGLIRNIYKQEGWKYLPQLRREDAR